MSETHPTAPVTDIAMNFRIRGGRKVMILPDGSRAVMRREATIDNTMVKVLARGFRWRRLLESGEYSSIDALAAAEKIEGSYVCRILRLAHLAPSIVEAILEGRHPPQLTMKDLMKPFPLDWKEQERWFSRTFVESDQRRGAAGHITNALERQAAR
jgi:hypothetical protein